MLPISVSVYAFFRNQPLMNDVRNKACAILWTCQLTVLYDLLYTVSVLVPELQNSLCMLDRHC